MLKILIEEMKRLVRHGSAPWIAWGVANTPLTQEQGEQVQGTLIVIAVTIVAYGWSLVRAKYPLLTRFI